MQKKIDGPYLFPKFYDFMVHYVFVSRLSNVSGFYHKLNINILMVEYRGYGLSEGAPNERGLYIDAQSAIDYIMQRTDVDRTKIIVFGRSLGNCHL